MDSYSTKRRLDTSDPLPERLSPQKRRKLGHQAPNQDTPTVIESSEQSQLGKAQDTTVTEIIDSQTWSQLIDDTCCTIDSDSSDITSPQSSQLFDGQYGHEVALFSPLDTTISPVTDYSEWQSSPAGPSTTSTKGLIRHFSNEVAPLILFDVDGSTDRFCELLTSLADDDAPITAAICAVSVAHFERVGMISNDRVATDFHSLALARLATLIESGLGHEMTLATIFLLISYELVAHGSSSAMMQHHLRGAYSTMLAITGEKSELMRFLEFQFRCYDVVVAFSLGAEPIGHAPALGYTPTALPNQDISYNSLSDISQDLWPVMHRLASLPGLKQELGQAITKRQVSRAAVLRGEISSLSRAIEAALVEWTTVLSEQNDFTCASRLVLAYSHSGLVYLYRHILGYPQRHQLVQTSVQATITHCSTMVSGKITAGLLWPLFTAACEAIGSERLLAEQTFDLIKEQQHANNVNQAWPVIQAIWKGVDENARKGFRAEDTVTAWRRVEKAMDIKLILL